jgi:TorA maturation chaperone TorD
MRAMEDGAASLSETVAALPSEDLLKGASLACRFFGLLFHHEPSDALLHGLNSHALLEDWPLPVPDQDGAEGLALLRGFLKQRIGDASALARREYTALFIGPERPLGQWESVWTSEDKLLFDESSMAVRAFYARHGVAAPGPDPEDHIALELLFLGELLDGTSLASEAGEVAESERLKQEARLFFERHLGRWAGMFLDELESRAVTDFYRGAAKLCRASLKMLGCGLDVAGWGDAHYEE